MRIKNILREMDDTPIGSLQNLFAIVGAIGSAVTTLFGLSGGGGGGSFTLPLGSLPFPLLLLLFVIAVASVGWSFGLVVALLTDRRDEFSLWVAHLVAVCAASLLIGLASLVVDTDTRQAWPVLEVIALFGVVVFLTLTRVKFKSMGAATENVAIRRAGTLSTFAAAAVFVVILTDLARG